MPSRGVIDLRKRVQNGQQRLFQEHSPKGPERRPLSLRAKRRRKRALFALLFIFLIGGSAWGASLVSYMPRFNIGTILVEGARTTPPQLVSKYVESILNDGSYRFLSRGNIFLYPRDAIEKAVVEYFPRIKSAHLSRGSLFSTSLRIEIEEREPFALWCNGEGDCYTMDEGGFIFAEAPSATSSLYVFKGGFSTSTDPIGKTFIKAQLPGLLALLQKLGQAGSDPRGATILEDQDFLVPLAEGFTLKASFGEDAGALARNLELVLASDTLKGKGDRIEYIDLRFGNRVYYKLKGEEQRSAQ